MDLGVVLRIAGFGTIILFLLAAAMFRNAMQARQAATRPEFGLGALASALGLSIVRGDPAFHLINGAEPSFLLRLFGVVKWDIDLLLEGTPLGRPTRLSITESCLRVKFGRTRLVDKHTHESRLSVVGVRLPARFEFWTEESSGVLVARPRLGLPVVHRGAGPHGPWCVATDNAAAIQPILAQLESLAQRFGYFHAVASEDRIDLVMSHIALMTLVPQLPEAQQELVALANALEGGASAHA